MITPAAAPRFLLVLLFLAGLSLLLGLALGSQPLSLLQVTRTLVGQGEPLHQLLVLELRLPRVLGAFAIGGLLALAGCLMQVLLRNPLADPYILGLSGGAATAALLAMLLGVTWITGAAFMGALLSTLLVFGLARGHQGWTPTRLLLTGVVLAAGWGALISFILATAPVAGLPGMLFWLMGDLSRLQHSGFLWGLLILSVLLMLPLGRSLNLLSRGALQAAALGLAVRPLEWLIYLLAALMTATAVAHAGSIGFVGLIVPHAMRLLIGGDHRMVIPASVLGGGILLVLADTLARILIAPQQLPVGVITALLGVPIFLWLLYRSRNL